MWRQLFLHFAYCAELLQWECFFVEREAAFGFDAAACSDAPRRYYEDLDYDALG